MSVPGSAVQRPVRELKGFASAVLQPGEARQVSALLRRADLAYWHPKLQQWVVEPGEYEVHAGVSSRDLRTTALVSLTGDEVKLPVTGETTLGELMADPEAAASIMPMFAAAGGETGEVLGMDMVRMMSSIPLGRLNALRGGQEQPAADPAEEPR